jgi:hypothetical protein
MVKINLSEINYQAPTHLSKCRKVTQNKMVEKIGIYTCFAVTIASFILKNIPQNA